MQQLLYSAKLNLQEVPQIADHILGQMGDASVLLMEGDLGTGKTTLAKIILKKLGVTSEITSPTFNIVNEYRDNSGKVFLSFRPVQD